MNNFADTHTKLLFEEETKRVCDCAFEVHKVLGCGFLEKVYENALIHELGIAQLEAVQQIPLSVSYKNCEVGHYIADLIVNKRIIIEIKTVVTLTDVHKIQLLNYLKATGLKVGLLINFGNKRIEIKRVLNNTIE